MEKKRVFLNHKKSSALLVSVIIHVVFLLIAATFVAVSVIVKNETDFEAKPIKRPKMNLRKLQVPVDAKKRRDPPKLRKTIVVKTPTPKMDIHLPEIVGVKGGLGAGGGSGFSLGFDFDLDLFGGNSDAGNQFIGTFYDLKQTADGEPSRIGELFASKGEGLYEAYFEAVRDFIRSGWRESRLEDYFQAPRKKYTSSFMIPVMEAVEAPRAYGVEDQVKPSYWVCHYKGEIAAPETGRYRFVGLGDDVLMVRIGKKLVMDACYRDWVGKMSDWESRDDDNRKLPIGNWSTYQMVIGDWFKLTKGQPVNMEVLIGEMPGGKFAQILLIEQDGRQYRQVRTENGLRSVLPVFKTTEIPEALVPKMKINPNEETLQGPVFGVLETSKSSPF